MVSVNPNPPDGGFYLDLTTRMALPGLGSFSTAPAATASSDDPSKKVRKPYTITKSRESWTEPEHDKFLEALQLFDRDWKKIEAFVGSKSVIQIRSHAQKYFLKAQKSGAREHLPPPRPKRKAAHPYPQKASKNVPAIPQVGGSFDSFHPAPVVSEPVSMRRPDPSLPKTPVPTNAAVSHLVPSVGIPHATKGDVRSGQLSANNCCSSTESTPKTWPSSEKADHENHSSTLRVLPDFAQVYSFLGSVFDSSATDHLQKLKKMDPIDVDTVLLLMRNLSVNLMSPDFEEHRKLLSSYKIDSEKNDSCGLHGASCDDQSDGVKHCG